MPHYPVKQPNGKYAIYSTVTETLLGLDMTTEEVVSDFLRDSLDYPGGAEQLRLDVLEGLDNISTTGLAWPWSGNWNHAVWWTCFYHGQESDALKTALKLGLISPNELDAVASQTQKEHERLDILD